MLLMKAKDILAKHINAFKSFTIKWSWVGGGVVGFPYFFHRNVIYLAGNHVLIPHVLNISRVSGKSKWYDTYCYISILSHVYSKL